ncbi:MAG TPA: SusC/RagA family TonB-linked outer membrane protein [Hanamia sp.]
MKQQSKRLLLFFSMLFCVALVSAQERQVSGTVKDANGNLLQGVSVAVKGGNALAATDANGHFSVSLTNIQKVLVFSFVGFTTKEVNIGNSSNITVELVTSEGSLNEVVVTALGIKRERRSIGYAVSTIKAEELTKAGTTMNPFLSLYGKASGVGVNTGTAGPMGGLKINIRGAASLNPNQNTRPLFVVDGVIISDRQTSIGGSTGAGYDYGSNINDINSADIESIDILKGAKATVLYGTDAANGVVLITTKSGRNAKGFGMTGSFQYSIEKPRSYLDLQKEYGLGNSIYDTSYVTLNGKTVREIPNRRYSFGPKFDGADVMFYDSTIVKNNPHNSYDDLFRTGSSYTSNVAISGSSEKGNLRASYTNYKYNDIVSPNSWQQRNTFSFNGNIKASKFASFELISNIYNIVSQNRRESNSQSIAWGFPVDYDYNQMYALYKDQTGYKRDLSLYGVPQAGSLVGDYLWNLDKNRVKDDKFHMITSARATLNFTEHIFLVGQFGLDYDNTNYSSEISVNRILPAVQGGGFSIKKENNTIQSYQALLNYNNTFFNENFGVSGFGGFIYRLRTSESLGTNTIGGLNFPGWYSFNNQAGAPDAGNAYLLRDYARGSDVLYSAVASATLSWKNEFYMDLQARQDWNSTLPPENNKYFFPGASLTWNYTERYQIPGMNRGQVRFSWADVGNGTTRYFANNQYGLGYISGTGAQAVVVTPPGNLLPGALKPERKREFEIGINNSFFKGNRVTLDFSYYTNNRYNQIISLPISQTSSSSGLLINVANMRTYGFEFSLTGTPLLTKNLRWDITLNGANQGSKVLELYGDLKEYTYANLINGSSASIRADLNRPFGDIKMNDYTRDENGNKVVNVNGVYTLDSDPAKMKVLGNIMPKLFGGVLSDFRYKNLAFRIALDYKYGGTIFSYTNERLYGLGQLESTLKYRDEANGGLAYYINGTGDKIAWQHNEAAPSQSVDGKVYHDGVILPGVRLGPDNKYVTNDIIASASDYYLTYVNDLSTSFPPDKLLKNDYIKMREIALSYTLPASIVQRLKLQALTITLAGRNLFYLYKTIPNIDVESALGADSYIENTVFPGQQTYSLGLNVSF